MPLCSLWGCVYSEFQQLLPGVINKVVPQSPPFAQGLSGAAVELQGRDHTVWPAGLKELLPRALR